MKETSSDTVTSNLIKDTILTGTIPRRYVLIGPSINSITTTISQQDPTAEVKLHLKDILKITFLDIQ